MGVRYRNNSYVLSTLDERGEYAPTYLDAQTYVTWDPDGYGPGKSRRWGFTDGTTIAFSLPPGKPTSGPSTRPHA